MIIALRVGRGILVFFIVWQIITLTDIFVNIMLHSNQPLSSYMLGAITGKIVAAFLFSLVAIKSRKYINALYEKNENTTLLLKSWYSI